MSTILEKTIKNNIEINRLDNTRDAFTHSHNFLEITYVISGEAAHQIDECTGEIKTGNFFVIDYDTTHSYLSNDSNLTIINCLFLPEFLDSSFPNTTDFNKICERFYFKRSGRLINGPASNVVFCDDGNIGELFLRMHKEYTEKKEGYILMLRHLLSQIIIEIIRKVGSNDEISACTAHIVRYINENYSKKISLSSACEELGYSLPYISTKFRKEMGVTFTQYLQNRRIEEAYCLLTETDMHITEISERCGYDNLKFFGKIFKQTTKMSPRELRSRGRRR